MIEGKRNVLVVEDDDDIRESLLVVLEDEGYLARAAANGRDALALIASSGKPDVILLDLMMPILNGWELMSHLSRDPELQKTPIIIMSAVGDRRVHPNGAVAFLEKPVALTDLLAALKTHA